MQLFKTRYVLFFKRSSVRTVSLLSVYPREPIRRGPIEKLDHAAMAIDKYKQEIRQGIHPQIGADDASQSILGLAHIANCPIQINVSSGDQGNHGRSAKPAQRAHDQTLSLLR